MTDPILSVRDLHVSFPSEAGLVEAVRGVNFDLYPKRTLCIVGESGSGKSVSSLAIMGLLPSYAKITGSVRLGEEELLGKGDVEMSEFRGKDLGMIFQDPLSALTPVFDVGTQIVEALQAHDKALSSKAAWERAVELLDLVGIPNPQRRVKAFPHEFSGGMRQRVVIAQAIANNPRVLIADEPTTALDVTIQAQILDVIDVAQQETGAGVIMITHDMGVVAGVADDVIVMYAGKPVEVGTVDEVFYEPHMPYTIGLLGSIPRADQTSDEPLVPITGNPPTVIDFPDICPFSERCPVATDACLKAEPSLESTDPLVPTQKDGIDPSGELVFVHSAACVRSHEIEGRMIGGEALFPVPERPADAMGGIPREERRVVLDVKDLVKTFPLVKGAVLKRRIGSVYAVNGVDFELRAGETLAIVGESGSGKSTTIRCLLGLYHPDAGTVRVLGMNPSASARDINRRVAYVPGEVALWPNLTGQQALDALAALRGSRDEARERELVERFRLDPSKPIRTYSKGNRQKVMLVAALSAPVDLLVLDEPTSGLDPLMERIFGECVAQASRAGRTVLLSSHILGEVQELCSHVTIIKDGAAVETGSLERLRHLGAREIRVRGEEDRLRALVESLEAAGIDASRDEGDVLVEAGASRVPDVLGAAVSAGLADITCTPASLEDLFLRHYEGTVR